MLGAAGFGRRAAGLAVGVLGAGGAVPVAGSWWPCQGKGWRGREGESLQSSQPAVISRMEAALGNLKRASSLLIHVTEVGGTEGRGDSGPATS